MADVINKYDTDRFMGLFELHMDAAYNLARWLLRDDAAAQDTVQESFIRAFAAQNRFDGKNAKAWLLTIVRNRCYSWLKQNRSGGADIHLDDDWVDQDAIPELANHQTPESFLIGDEAKATLNKALDELPPAFREVIILKELEDMSYKEIAAVTGIPIGTVMSRLARGRAMLHNLLVGKYGHD